MRINSSILNLWIVAFIFVSASAGLDAQDNSSKEMKISEMNVQEHFNAGEEAFKTKKWDTLIKHFKVIKENFPSEPHAKDANYYIAVAYFFKGDPEIANKYFSRYLDKSTQPHFFEQAQVYRLLVAKQFRKGAKRHLFGVQKLPRWLSARSEAIKILDEIAISMPYQDIAAKALYEQGTLFYLMKNYRDGAESFNLTIKRFPGDSLAIKSYQEISKLYLDQSKKEYQNPDLLDLAEINLMRFRTDFPGDENDKNIESNFQEMREIYAGGLLETGQYFERKKKPKASAIYYLQALALYPGTKASEISKGRLQDLQKKSAEIRTLVEASKTLKG